MIYILELVGNLLSQGYYALSIYKAFVFCAILEAYICSCSVSGVIVVAWWLLHMVSYDVIIQGFQWDILIYIFLNPFKSKDLARILQNIKTSKAKEYYPSSSNLSQYLYSKSLLVTYKNLTTLNCPIFYGFFFV